MSKGEGVRLLAHSSFFPFQEYVAKKVRHVRSIIQGALIQMAVLKLLNHKRKKTQKYREWRSPSAVNISHLEAGANSEDHIACIKD